MHHFLAFFVVRVLISSVVVPIAKHYIGNNKNKIKYKNEIKYYNNENQIKNEMMRRQLEEMTKNEMKRIQQVEEITNEMINEIIKCLELKKNEDKGSTILSSLYKMWVAIKNLFRDKKKTAIQLDSEMRSLKQGSLSIANYCKKLKALSDGLSDVGYPVNNQSLVIQAIKGLNQSSTIINSLLRTANRQNSSFKSNV